MPPDAAQSSTERDLARGVAGVFADLGIPHADAPTRLTRIPGGASRETWLVEVGEDSDWRYVLRRDPPGTESLVSQAQEFELISLAESAEVPVPRLLHLESAGGRFGTAGILMEHVPGESLAPRILRRPEFEAARGALPGELGEALAKIHSVDPSRAADGLGAISGGGDAVDAALERWTAELEEIGEPLPSVEVGLRWLRLNRPNPVAARLVHGDFRLGNFIVDQSGLAAVIDWELAHLGDPAEDLGWLCIRSWRFGNDERRVGGLGSLDEFLASYRAAGGEAIESERIHYWEVFGNLKWAVICARQARDHTTGLRPSHELASLGRRICEPEWDMLGLISEGTEGAG